MTAVHHKDDARIKQLRRLILAEQSMLVIADTCERELARSHEFNQSERMVMSVGIATLYSSPFTNAEALGPLEDAFSKFEDEQCRITHKHLLDVRNEVYAHRDYANAKMQIGDNVEKMHQVHIHVNHLGILRHGAFRLYFARPELEKVLILSKFQHHRLAKKAHRIISHLTKHKIISPGHYTLGETFP